MDYPVIGSWARLTADESLSLGPIILRGILIQASADGGDVTLWAARSEVPGREFFTFQALANESLRVFFGPGVLFADGLYVDVGPNITVVTLLWDEC